MLCLWQDASAGGAEGEPVTSYDEPQKATGADSASKHASASEPQNADAEPMEVDGQQALISAMEAEPAGVPMLPASLIFILRIVSIGPLYVVIIIHRFPGQS